MNPRTQATLDELADVVWFRNVGIRDTEAVFVLSSWEEAIASCATPDWENQLLHASNELHMRLVERDIERYRRWNEIAIGLKPRTMALVREKTWKVIAENNLPKVFLDTVDWDILGVCMEAEYADVFPPAFYASQAYWYRAGHFPCGWRDGQFPEGKLVVY